MGRRLLAPAPRMPEPTVQLLALTAADLVADLGGSGWLAGQAETDGTAEPVREPAAA
jgi:hypothetical protein